METAHGAHVTSPCSGQGRPEEGPRGLPALPPTSRSLVSPPAGRALSHSGRPAPTYPSGSAAPPSSAPSAWPPAAPPTGTAPPWGWAGRWLRSGPTGPARSPPGLATGLGPGPPACSLPPRPPRPPACPRPRPRSSHLVQKTGVRASRACAARPQAQEHRPRSSLLTSWGAGPPTAQRPIYASPSRGHPTAQSGQRLWASEWVSVRDGNMHVCCGKDTDRTADGSPRSHTHTHTHEGCGRRQDRTEDRGREERVGGGPGGSGWVSGHRHRAVWAAGGLGAGSRRRWSLVPSWVEGTPMVEALSSSGVRSWLPVPPATQSPTSSSAAQGDPPATPVREGPSRTAHL